MQPAGKIVEDGAGVLVGVTGMHDDRHVTVDGDLQLLFKHIALDRAVGVIVVVVETDFPHREDAFGGLPFADGSAHRRGVFFCLVGVDALSAPDTAICFGQGQYPVQVVR